MRLYEIENKFFFIDPGSILILESYQDPEQELKIEFIPNTTFVGNYLAHVTEKITNRPLVLISFELHKNGNIVVGNMIPADDPNNNKIVHTSLGTQYNGVDIGIPGIRWILRQIRDYARSEGYDVKKIVSGTRYTGSQAKNNTGSDDSGLPKNFDVSRQLKESISYDCITDTFIEAREKNE